MWDFFYIIPRAFLIGVMISAPMGPTGVLCIQRTLNKGRRSGFFTGLGASFSDLIYCLVTGFGLSYVTDFITKNQYILQIIGSLVIVVYAIYLFFSNPSKQLKPSEEKNNNYIKDCTTGFLFTLSNPLIVFLIIGLFAQFSLMRASYNIFHYIAGYLAICCGAVIWWWFITFIVNKARRRFNLQSMKIVNRIIAVVLCIMAMVGIFVGVKYYIMNVFHLI